MDLDWTDEQAAFRASVQAFARDRVAPLAAGLPRDRAIERAEIDAVATRLAGAGVVDEVPRSTDGSVDLLALAIVAEELWRVDGSLGFVLTQRLTGRYVLEPFLRDESSRAAVAADAYLCAAITEPDVGSNPAAVMTRAQRTPDGWHIDGTKVWISGATTADLCVVVCRVDGRDGADAVAPFLVPTDTPGFEARAVPCIGLRGAPTCEVVLDGCVVGESAELTPGGGGLAATLAVFERARCFVALGAVGLAQAALDHAVAYAREREQFGRPIARFQLVQAMLVEMATATEAGRLLAYRAASLVGSGKRAVAESSMAKAYCTEMAVRVASLGVQVHGASGLASGSAPERILRDARMLTIPDGTTQIQTLIIGRELTGHSALV